MDFLGVDFFLDFADLFGATVFFFFTVAFFFTAFFFTAFFFVDTLKPPGV
jgi:hypothetical protein